MAGCLVTSLKKIMPKLTTCEELESKSPLKCRNCEELESKSPLKCRKSSPSNGKLRAAY